MTTERLQLRRFHLGDAGWYAAMNGDAEVMRFVGRNLPLTRAESDESLAKINDHWAERGFGLWAADRRDTGEPIGFIGLAIPLFLQEVSPCVEVGWRLARSHWGLGFASEGARAAVEQAFITLGLDQIVSITVHDNVRSQRVMQKLGLTWDRGAVHSGTGTLLQVRALTRASWQSSTAAPDRR